MPVKELLSQLIEETSDLVFVIQIIGCHQCIVKNAEFFPLSVRRACRVDRIEGVLLQIYGIEQLALLINNVIFCGSSFLTDYLHHLVDFISSVQNGTCFFHTGHINNTVVFGPGIHRMDGRVFTGIGTLSGKSVECTDYLQRCLCNRLLEVTTCR